MGGGEGLDAAVDGLLSLAIDQVITDEAPAAGAVHIAGPVVHAEAVPRVLRVRVLGVEEQPAVGPRRVEAPPSSSPER